MQLPSFLGQFLRRRRQTEEHMTADLEQQQKQQEALPNQQTKGGPSNGGLETPVSDPYMQQSLYPPPTPALLAFQLRVGICSPPYLRGAAPPSGAFGRGGTSSSLTLTNSAVPSRAGSNEGIYTRTVEQESKTRLQYSLSIWAVNTFFMLQIIVGAALTALGAAKGPPAAVTVLGAVNTIVAGLLTYLKGQGLPARLEAYLQQLRALREYIEEVERRVMRDGAAGFDVDREVGRIWEMYQEVRQTEQDNRPGNVLPPRGLITGLLKKPDIERKDVMAPTGDKPPAEVLKHGISDLREYSSGLDKLQHLPGIGQSSSTQQEQQQQQHGGIPGVGAGTGVGVGDRISDIKGDLEHLGGMMGKVMHHGRDEATEQVGAVGASGSAGAKKEVDQVTDSVRGVLQRGAKELEKRLDHHE